MYNESNISEFHQVNLIGGQYQKVGQVGSTSIPESEIVKLWQKMPGRAMLVDSEGISVEVVYPGRCNDGRGADFRDAVIASAGTRHHGSIEIHSRTSHWQSHGHHRDPVYNQVVLHVAWQQDRPGRTVLENGSTIPTVVLDHQTSDLVRGPVNTFLPCRNSFLNRSPRQIAAILEQAGDERFAQKSRRYENELSVQKAGEVIYQGIMEALGYTRNTIAFRDLAAKAPLDSLEAFALASPTSRLALARIQAVLLSKAGFFRSQCLKGYLSAEYLKKMKTAGSIFSAENIEDYPSWELFKVRPGNHPVVRLLSFGYLLLRFRRKGLLSSLLDLVTRLSLEKNGEELERALTVAIWIPEHNNPYIFLDRPGTSPVLLGQDRVREIIVNVILPFSFARGLSLPGPCRDGVHDFYTHFPRLATNSVERHMLVQTGISHREVNSARRQQGLLHIYKTLCIRGGCAKCPLGN